MKNKIILFFTLVLNSFLSSSQSKVYTSIQEYSKTYPDKNFSFEKVIDARQSRSNIGIVHKAYMHENFYADLRDSLPIEFFNFLSRSFPNGSKNNKIIVVIKNLEIGHKMTRNNKDTGYVIVDFDFYKSEADSAIFIYNFKHKLLQVSDNIPLTHADRIKEATLLSVSKLDTLPWLNYRVNPVLLPDSLKRSVFSFPNRNFIIRDSIDKKNNYPRNRVILLMGHAEFGLNANLYGGNVSFLRGLTKHPKVLMGLNINYSAIVFNSDFSIAPYSSYKLKTSDFGFKLLRQIKNSFFYDFNTHFLIGQETFSTQEGSMNNGIYTYREKSSSNLFFGVQIDNGFVFFHPKNTGGFAFGADIFIRFSNSSILDAEAGIKLNAGFAF